MPDRLSEEEVAHVAMLARLSFESGEIALLAEQLSAVLDHAAAVLARDLSSTPPTSHAVELENVLRDDVVSPGLDREEVLRCAPATESGRFRVPRILGEAP